MTSIPQTVVTSTPSKVRIVTQTASKSSVDAPHAIDAGNYTSSGIKAERFIQIGFGLHDKYVEWKEKARGWIYGDDQGETWRALVSAYKSQVVKSDGEVSLYNAFIAMGMFVINRARGTKDAQPGRQLKLINTSSKAIPGIWGSRKPDISLVPVHVNHATKRRTKASRSQSGQSSTAASGTEDVPAAANATQAHGRGESPNRLRLRVCGNGRIQHAPAECAEDDDTNVDAGDDDADSDYIDASEGDPNALGWEHAHTICELKVSGPGPPVDAPPGITQNGRGREENDVGNSDERASKRQKLDISTDAPDDNHPQQNFEPQGGRDGGGRVNGAETSANSQLPRTSLTDANADAPTGDSPDSTLQDPFSSASLSYGKALETDNAVSVTHIDTQLASYIAEMKSARGDRKYIFSAAVHNMKFWLYFHSNDGSIKSNAIMIDEQPEVFALFFGSFVTQTLETLGFNEWTGYYNPFNLRDRRTLMVKAPLKRIPGGHAQGEGKEPVLSDLRRGKQLSVQYCFIGSGTVFCELSLRSAYGVRLVMKYSWEPTGRRSEESMVLMARSVDPDRTPEIFASAEIIVASPFVPLRDGCSMKSPMFEIRKLRIIIMREYFPISNISNGKVFVDAIVQTMSFIHKLHKSKQLLIRNIGIQNLAYYTDSKKQTVIVLTDYSQASTPLLGGPEPTSDHRDVDLPFAAVEVLTNPRCVHGLHHDLESLLFCTVWHAVGYRPDKPFPRPEKVSKNGIQPVDHLKTWRIGSRADVGIAKRGFIAVDTCNLILDLADDSYMKKFCEDLADLFNRAKTNRKKPTYAKIVEKLERWHLGCKDWCCKPNAH